MNQPPERCAAPVVGGTQNPARGWLRNGNPSGDFHNCVRCGAKTRAGRPCRSPAMKNGRCRMHGGTSTGPRTDAGLERCRQARLKTLDHSQLQRTYCRMLLEITRCVNITGAIARAKANAVLVSGSGPGQVHGGSTSKLIGKAERLLHRVWASASFLSFARRRARAIYRDYLSFCVLTDHPLPPRSRYPAPPSVEGRDRAALLVDLLCRYVEVVSSNPILVSGSGADEVTDGSATREAERARPTTCRGETPESVVDSK
jgi:hypothetical protein